MSSALSSSSGGRFDFDDGGTYCGGWLEGKAHGHGLCTGPKGQGYYAGTWDQGFESCGVYTWPTGSTYEGQWGNGKRHGLGVETRGCWVYRGEWTEGFKGRYGCRQSIASGAKYDGTWMGGLQDGYGSETYADGGTFQGQWAKGMRHGYGVRTSAPFGLAAHRRPSVRKPNPAGESPSPDRRPEEVRGGFVLKDFSARDIGTWGRSLPDQNKGSAFKNLMSKTKSMPRRGSFDEFSEEEGDGSDSDVTESSFVVQDEVIDGNVIETYMGEWKNDKRSGFGIAERSDGIKYEGEWFNNKKFGYGLTTYKSGIQEYGKYKNNALLQSGGKKHLFILRSGKFKERVQEAVSAAHRASQIALQKADIAISRTATARGKAEQADGAAKQARAESEIARMVARQFAPEFQQPGPELQKRKFTSSQDLSGFPPHILGDDSSHRSFQVSNPGESYGGSPRDSYLRPQPEFDDNRLSPEPPPTQSAFLDIFRNNPDRRPSNAGFLRRPSAVNLRRPSTVVELKLVPSTVEKSTEFIPDQRNYHYQQQQQHPQQQQYQHTQQQQSYQHAQQQQYQHHQQYQQQQQYHHQQQQQRPQLNFQQVVNDHLSQYKVSSSLQNQKNPAKKKPAVDLTELFEIYGIPLGPSRMDDDEGTPYLPQRRSTMPNVLDPNFLQPESEGYKGDGLVRSGSLYTPKAEPVIKAAVTASVRKKSLPDITNINANDSNILSREAIAVLSSQRREAIRRQEEEAERLRANPLLYLLSPEVWDWLASQQLIILVLVINIALGLLFFKVIL